MAQLAFSIGPEESIDGRIEQILAGKAGPWVLSADECVVLRMLKEHKGAANPVALNTITIQLGMSPRTIKSTMKSLIEDFGLPIGGSRQEPHGYFLILTAEDLASALRPLVHEMRSMRRRVDALEVACREMTFFQQVRMQLETAASEEP